MRPGTTQGRGAPGDRTGGTGREAGRYSLWLMPAEEAGRRLSEVIERLSRRHGSPLFEPHLTLLGGIEGREKDLAATTRTLAAAIGPLRMRLRGVGFAEAFYRCLYLKVEETGELMAAREAACRAFGLEGGIPFVPHVSLVYGTLPVAAKTQIRAALGRTLEFECTPRSLRLVSTANGPSTWGTIVEIDLGR